MACYSPPLGFPLRHRDFHCSLGETNVGNILMASLLPTHTHPLTPPQQRRSDCSGEMGERPWLADLIPKGGAYSGLLLAAWKAHWTAFPHRKKICMLQHAELGRNYGIKDEMWAQFSNCWQSIAIRLLGWMSPSELSLAGEEGCYIVSPSPWSQHARICKYFGGSLYPGMGGGDCVLPLCSLLFQFSIFFACSHFY